jgi:PAS domain S-box-containing protein
VASLQGSPAGGAEVDVAAEPHLRAVLESQPVVLARVGADGTFLAINESGLSMVGASGLEQMLGKSLCDLVGPEERDNCRQFLARVAGGDLGSLEVDITGLTGLTHTLEIHARPHPGAPDALPSALVTFRDVTEARRLEQSLVEAMARQTEQEAAHQADRSALVAEIEQLRQAADGQSSESGARVAELERAIIEAQQRHAGEIAELRQLAESQASDSSTRVAELEGQLLEAQRRHADESNRLSAEIAGLTEALDEQGRIVTEQTERLSRSSSLEADLAEARQRLDELTARYDTDTATLRQALDDGLRQAVEDAERRAAEAQSRYDAEQSERQAQLASAESALESARREREELQTRYDADTEALRTALNEAMGEQARLAETLGEQERLALDTTARIAALEGELVDVRGSHEARVAELERAIADAQSARDSRLAELEAALDSAERARHERVAELEERLNATEQSSQARVRELEAALDAAEQARNDVASELEGRVQGLQAEVESLGAAYKKADAAFLAERRTLESEIASAVAAREEAEARLGAIFAERDAARELLRRLADSSAALAREAMSLAPTAASAPAAIRAGDLAGGLEARMREELGAHVSLTMLVASESTVAVPRELFETALLAFAANRGGAIKSGEATVEIADVQIDDGVAAMRQMAPGSYVLWATHLSGKGAARHLPDERFDSADHTPWGSVDQGLQSALEGLRRAGMAAWLAHEGDNGIVLELYLPRDTGQSEVA